MDTSNLIDIALRMTHSQSLIFDLNEDLRHTVFWCRSGIVVLLAYAVYAVVVNHSDPGMCVMCAFVIWLSGRWSIYESRKEIVQKEREVAELRGKVSGGPYRNPSD